MATEPLLGPPPSAAPLLIGDPPRLAYEWQSWFERLRALIGDSTGGKFALKASPIFTGDPTAPTPAIGDDDTSIATTAFVRDIVPPGVIWSYGGTTAPPGFLLCDGSAVSRTTYAALFAVIGTTFGAGDGSTTFNLPDLRGRAIVALDNLGGTSANRITGAWADSLGGAGGAETHTLVNAELPGRAMIQNITGPPEAFTVAAPGSQLIDLGGGQAHNNVQPSMALGAIIKT
jgi:microcystin-dependent protein